MEPESASNRSKTSQRDATRVPPNRTADESPAGAEEATRRIENRDILQAPGQAPLSEQSRASLASDELYGQTQIPGRHDDEQQVKTKGPEKRKHAQPHRRRSR